MALSGSLPQINLGVQGEIQGGLHIGAQRVNPEFRVGSNFRIIPEQYFSGVENVVEFLENIDNNLTYYEIPTQLACSYLKGHFTGRALDLFEVLGYRVVEDKATDYAHLKQALSEHFPVVRNRSELETRFYSSFQTHNQKPSDFVYDLLKIHKILKLEMTEEKLIDHFISRLEPQILDYVEENWRETRGNNRYAENSRQRRQFNRFESQGVADNQRFDGRRRGGPSDHRFHNQGGSRNSAFKEQFNLFTDASGVGIGAVHNENHRLIAFASRTLNKAERNYTVTERKCLVVIWALHKFKTYFGSLPVKVITDHAALTKLTNGKNLSSRMIRWALKFSEFNIEWEHRPWIQNVVADVLSRNPVGNLDGSQISCAALRALALNSREQLIREQREDPELGHIYRYLENRTMVPLMRLYVRLVPGFQSYRRSTLLREILYNSGRTKCVYS
ncbi:retrovirus-related Pol polyprotein from transposon opus [Trichonephila clavipes]|nr:retrovirus-related Pol polyprotein from transposon opus [Trichonephila clavipes]